MKSSVALYLYVVMKFKKMIIEYIVRCVLLLVERFNDFFGSVTSFCRKHDIHMPNMSDRYMECTRHSCQQKNNITV